MGHDGVELALTDRSQQRRALHEIVARGGKYATLRQAADGVARSSHALQERRDPMRRADLADEIHMSDVDAQLERGGGDERAQPARLEPGFRVEACLFRQASVMRRDRALAEPFAQMPRQALGHPSRVHEDERRPMRRDERREPIVVLLPDLVRHHGVERGAGNLDAEIHLAAMSRVDDGARLARCADEVASDLVDRLLRGGQADPQQRLPADGAQPLEREGEMGATSRADHGVDFIDDDRAHGAQHVPAAFGGQQQVERLGRGDEDVRRRANHRGAFALRGVTRPDRRRDSRRGQPRLFRQALDPAPRFGQVLVDVRAQCLERGDVQHAHFIGQRRVQSFARQLVEGSEERRQGFSRAGRRRDERMPTVEDGLPAVQLGRCRLPERGA